MKKIHSLAVITAFIFGLIVSCSNSESNIVGLWTVEKVGLDADTTGIDSQTINKSIEQQKSLSIEFFGDKTMNIISNDGTFPGKWSFDKNTKFIHVNLDDYAAMDSVKIGKFVDGQIVNREKTAFGWMIITYKKE